MGYPKSQYYSLTKSKLELRLHALILNTIGSAYSELLINCDIREEVEESRDKHNKVNFNNYPEFPIYFLAQSIPSQV